ncbi:restriction endonuclease subunit S, partial [Brachyspira pilosicoli]|uniref:restriction endonuclease subunit S n=1 Tax=Brachyspira pilosicoli TaxID=52584 RepID=UPI001CA4E4D2
MSRLEELINKECPDGVEWKKLGDIGRVAMCKRVMKAETGKEGDIPFYKIGTFGKKADAFISRELFEEYRNKYSFPKKGDILISASGTIGRTVIYDGEPAYYQDSNIVWLEHDESIILNKYLFYYYQLKPWNITSGGTIQRLYNDNIMNAKIQIPPIEVQKEIVRILDEFTEKTNKLQELLHRETILRKKQYEYY